MLEAAGRAFADRGFHAASVDAIAAASGITKPMIYAYFGSKDGLYRACMERARVRLLDALRDGVDTSAPPDQQLWHGLLAVFTFVEREHDSWAILLGEVTQGTGPFAEEGAAVRRELAALIAELLRRAAAAEVEEVVLATNPTTTGEATALHIAEALRGQVAVTRLASGLPVGADLEHADEVTLGKALAGRRSLE